MKKSKQYNACDDWGYPTSKESDDVAKALVIMVGGYWCFYGVYLLMFVY